MPYQMALSFEAGRLKACQKLLGVWEGFTSLPSTGAGRIQLWAYLDDPRETTPPAMYALYATAAPKAQEQAAAVAYELSMKSNRSVG